MKNLTPAIQAHIKQGVTTLCTCIEIIRRDGTSFRFTDCDSPLTVANGVYTPVSSYRRNSISTTLALDVDSTSIEGILNSDYISREEIAAGLYDYADVTIFAVNFNDPDSGKIILRVGKLGEIVSREDDTFTAELRGLSQAYAYRIGEAYSPECRANLGDKRCKMPLSPPRWLPNNSYTIGQSIVGVINSADAFVNLGLTNAGFDTDAYVELARDLTGWTTYGDAAGRWTCRASDFHGSVGHDSYAAFGTDNGNINLDAYNNPQHTVADVGMYQDIDLEGQGLSPYSLDTGLCRVYSTIWMISASKWGYARYRIYALDESGAQIGSAAIYDTGAKNTSQDKWYQYTCNNVLIPAGTRKLRFDLLASKRPQDEEGAGFDTLYVAVNDPDGTLGSADQYGGVAFVAMNSGVSGSTEPTWGNMLGSTYTDGSITWKAVKAWRTTAYVGSVASGGAAITPTSVTDEDGYYDGGLLYWETGKNAGRAQEIKTWASGVLTLFERPFYLPQADDRFVIYPGCDGQRSTCVTKFSNILNFRAEPDVPGQDKYYNTPNASTS